MDDLYLNKVKQFKHWYNLCDRIWKAVKYWYISVMISNKGSQILIHHWSKISKIFQWCWEETKCGYGNTEAAAGGVEETWHLEGSGWLPCLDWYFLFFDRLCDWMIDWLSDRLIDWMEKTWYLEGSGWILSCLGMGWGDNSEKEDKSNSHHHPRRVHMIQTKPGQPKKKFIGGDKYPT